MNWQVVARPQAENDVSETADWYDSQRPGLGVEFIEEVLTVFDALEINPLLNCRQHPTKNIRWRYPKRFPYRVIYEVVEEDRLVIVAAVIHAVRDDRVWRSRV
jgi:toxin ParE1/3/4